jgi:hypothetical protein
VAENIRLRAFYGDDLLKGLLGIALWLLVSLVEDRAPDERQTRGGTELIE